jgi:hypothetical protein
MLKTYVAIVRLSPASIVFRLFLAQVSLLSGFILVSMSLWMVMQEP